jgi:hypothetical protein
MPSHRIHGSIRFLAIPALVMLSGAVVPAWSQSSTNAPVLYELTGTSTFQRGCFAPCECPVTSELPLVGTFKLLLVSVDPLFKVYSVTDVSWNVAFADATLHISGAGTYRVGGEFALTNQLELDLLVGDQQTQHFDSGLVPGGSGFPSIHIVISANNMTCFDTVMTVDARPRPVQPTPLPRHANFALSPAESSVDLSLFSGGGHSKLGGSIRLFLGDPAVALPGIPGLVGLSVDGADLIAFDFQPSIPGIPEPLCMTQNPKVHSIGSWNTQTGQISVELSLIAPAGNLPVPMPLHLSGTLLAGVLNLTGNNGNVTDAHMSVVVKAFEVNLPAPPVDLWFSTEVPFHAGRLAAVPAAATPALISAGDLLSRRGHVVRTNHELTAHLGIMPIVPDLGLDAVVSGPKGEIWFSFDQKSGPIWSETLSRYLKPGDLLSEAGYVVRTNEDLLAAFRRMPPVSDAGLDAVVLAPDKSVLFSTNVGFFSQGLGVNVGHGDLLSDRGRVVMTNQQLLQNFKIVDPTMRPVPADYGLDAVVLRSNGEIWFSTEVGFNVQRPDDATQLEWIDGGDLLSTRGYVVARNRDLLAAFAPVEDLASFGLDAVTIVVPPVVGDLDGDGDVDADDLDLFRASSTGPGIASQGPLFGDLDGDGDVDQVDFGIMQRCLGGDGEPANPNCAN